MASCKKPPVIGALVPIDVNSAVVVSIVKAIALSIVISVYPKVDLGGSMQENIEPFTGEYSRVRP